MPRKLSEDLRQHHVAEVQCRDGQQCRQHDRQDVAEDDGARRCAEGAGGVDEQPALQLRGLGACGAQVDRDAGDRQHQNDVRGAGREHVQDDDREQQRREAHDHVGDAHRHGLAPAAVEAGPHADGRADDRGDHHRGDRDGERRLARDDESGQHAAAKRVGAKEVGPAVRERERCLVGVVEVDLGGEVADEHRAEDGGEEDEAEDQGCDGGDAVVEQHAEPLRCGALLAGLADDGGGRLDGNEIDSRAHGLCLPKPLPVRGRVRRAARSRRR